MERLWRILIGTGIVAIITLELVWFFLGREVHTSTSSTKTVTLTATNYSKKKVDVTGNSKKSSVTTNKDGVFILDSLVVNQEYTIKGSSFTAVIKVNKQGKVEILRGSLVAGAFVRLGNTIYQTQSNVIDIRSLKGDVDVIDDNVISIKNTKYNIKKGQVVMLPEIPGQTKNIVAKVTHISGKSTQKLTLEPVSLSDVYQQISSDTIDNVNMSHAQVRSWDGSNSGGQNTVYADNQPTVTLSLKNDRSNLKVHVNLDQTKNDTSLSANSHKASVKNSGTLEEELNLKLKKFNYNAIKPENTTLEFSSEYKSDLQYGLSIGGQIIKQDRLIAMIDVPIEEVPGLEMQVPLYLHYEADGTVKLQVDYKNSLVITAGVKSSKIFSEIEPSQSANVNLSSELKSTVGLHLAPTLRLAFVTPKISFKYGGLADYKVDDGINNLLRLDGSANLKYEQIHSSENSKASINGDLEAKLTSPTVNWFMGSKSELEMGPYNFFKKNFAKDDDAQNSQSEADKKEFMNKIGNKIYTFSWGAGGWNTQMLISTVGSFNGVYFNSEMGDTGDNNPNGTVYLSDFRGTFTEVEKISSTQYSMKVETLQFPEVGKDAFDQGTKYVTAAPYGISNNDKIIVYLPGESTADKPKELYDWLRNTSPDYDSDSKSFAPKFTSVVLYDVSQKFGWSSTNQMDMTNYGSFDQNGEFHPL